jgi:hypothetical protein
VKTWTATKLDMGNNETLSVGISQLRDDAPFTAMTYSQSKDFKTFKGAKRWLTDRGFTVADAPDAP